MPDSVTASVFKTGGSQAVRLPAEFRFEVERVYVWRDEATGNVILSTTPRSNTAAILELLDEAGDLGAEAEGLVEDMAQLRRASIGPRNDPFEDWSE